MSHRFPARGLNYNPRMSDGSSEPAIDPRWPQLLSLSAHELRSPLSVVAGYIRMLLQQRAGPLSDDQLRLLQEAEKSCGRLSAVLAELSELARLESGTAPFNRSSVDLSTVLSEAISSMPALPDRVQTARLVDGPAIFVHGDAVRLKAAFSAIIHALLRELVSSTELIVRVAPAVHGGTRSTRLGIAEPSRLEDLMRLELSAFVPFDEWRGGTGLALPIARRILAAHGATLLGAPGDSKAAALVILPSIS